MEEVAQLIFSTLVGNAQFVSEMEQKCFPLYAKEIIDHPFAVYNIGEVSFESKEARMFPVLVSLCYAPDKYTEAIRFADVVKEIFEDLPNCNFLNTEQSFDQENQTIIININIQIIK